MMSSLAWLHWRRWLAPARWRRWLGSVRGRGAVGAALATILVFGVGAFGIRAVVRDRWMTNALDVAQRDGYILADDLSQGIPIPGGISPYVFVLADGRWLAWDGAFDQYHDAGTLSFISLPPADPDFTPPSTTTRTIQFPNRDPDYPQFAPSLAGRTLTVAETVTDILSPQRFATALKAVPGGLSAQRLTIYVLANPQQADAAVAGVDAVILWAMPIAVLFVAMVAAWATGRALRPVEAIRTRMAEVSAHALDQRVPVPASGDEISRLAETTNATLGRLQASVEQQRRFVADASHELRTPLANLRSALEVTLAHPNGVHWASVVADALSDTVRVQQLADDLLLLAQVDNAQVDDGKRNPLGTVDIAAIVEEQVAERAYIARDGPTFASRVTGLAPVLGTEAQLGRVVSNLLDNAARHAQSTVTATVTVGAEDIVMTVEDDGPGIPVADRDRVFDRFVRLDNARGRAAGGAGLGLAIVRDIIVRLGGRVWIADNPGGATLVVSLPTVGSRRC
jgi:signal transduction histidine kinase